MYEHHMAYFKPCYNIAHCYPLHKLSNMYCFNMADLIAHVYFTKQLQAPDIALQKCPYEGHAVMYASLAGLNILAEI